MKYYSHIPKSNDRQSQSGFTIVELMVATAVFSLVLVVILYGVLSFSHAYYGGVNSSNTQDTARSVISDASQAIEFSGNAITPTTNISGNTYYFCAGNTTYYFNQGAMYDGNTPSATDPGLFMAPGSCTSSPSFSTSAASGGKELLGTNMRVAYLKINNLSTNPRLYTVQLSLVYGDSDLLCNVSKGTDAGGCQPNAPSNSQGQSVQGTDVNDVECKQVTGSQFCAHTALSTTVSLRVANSELAP